MDKMKFIFNELVTEYPAGISTLQAGVSRMFDVDEGNILVGNGAAELINLLGILLSGRVLIPIPTFNEYLNINAKGIPHSKFSIKAPIALPTSTDSGV